MINFLKELATSTVATAPVPAISGTSIVAQSGHGSRFPSNLNVPFFLVAHPDNELPTQDNAEFLKVTNIATDTMTVVRGVSIGGVSPTAKSIATGWRISLPVITADLTRTDSTGFILYDASSGFAVGDVLACNTSTGVYYKANASSPSTAEVVGVVASVSGSSYEVITSGKISLATTYAGTGDVLFLSGATAGLLTRTEPTTVGHVSKPVMTITSVSGGTTYGSITIMRGMEIFADMANTSVVSDATPSGTVDSSNTSFSATESYMAGTLEIFINGLKQIRNTDYTESDPVVGSFSMAVAPVTGDIVRINYMNGTFGTGNADTVDGINASATATANTLYPLNSSSQFPYDVIGTNELGYAEVSTSQTGISTVADLTGLSVTVTVPTLLAGKKIIIEGWISQIYSTVATDRADFFIREGGTTLAAAYGAAPFSSTGWGGATIKCRLSPTAGSHTYKLSLARGVGSGTVATYADATAKAFIRVTVE